MKRLLLLTAIITAISTFTFADDFEDIKFKSEYGKGNMKDSKLEYTHLVKRLECYLIKKLTRKTKWDKTLAKGKRVQHVFYSP